MESKEPLRPGDFPEQKKLRGLYKHVKISVRTLDIIIVPTYLPPGTSAEVVSLS